MADPSPAVIRRLAVSDLDVLVPLFEGYRAFYERDPDPQGARSFLERRLTSGDAVVLGGFDGEPDGNPLVGFAQLYPIPESLDLAHGWILNDLFVVPEHRGRGTGAALLDAVRAYALGDGASFVSLETAPANAVAQRRYEAAGWVRDDSWWTYRLDL